MAPEFWSPLLRDVEANVAGAKERLFAALYDNLHRLAERELRADGAAGISPTTLLHETYLGISRGQADFPDRARFMSYAARVMRSLIIDFARERRAQKRGGGFHITQLDTGWIDKLQVPEVDDGQLQRLSEALEQLAVHDARLAELVDLKYFCGLTPGRSRCHARRIRTHGTARLGQGAIISAPRDRPLTPDPLPAAAHRL
jgi:RNA polymerase sigma factor (TIGR02999 family)